VSDTRRSPEAMPVAPAVAVHRVVKTYGEVKALDGLDLQIPAGITFGLLGPNGAGKSTLMKLLTGAVTATSGTVEVLGRPMPSAGRAVRARTGLVPQLDNLDAEITCAQSLEFYARLYGVPRQATAEAIATGLRIAQLEDRANAYVDELSGGMRRRLLIARALLHRPELVLLDEPTVGLDPQIRQKLWLLIDEVKGSGATVVLTTHYIEEAERLCETVAIVDHGRLLDIGAPQELIDRHVGTPIVVEVLGNEACQSRVIAAASAAGIQSRDVGTSVAVFTGDIDQLSGSPQLEPHDLDQRVRRPANLEDVFVNLTGEVLR
jgi:lipooligosaccharide transport system ATP-binding protein